MLSPSVVRLPANNVYGPGAGVYGVIKNGALDFVTCRERLHDRIDPNQVLYLAAGEVPKAITSCTFLYAVSVDPEVFANGIAAVERHLRLTTLSVVSRTNVPNLLQIQPNEFWATAVVRMSFLSILCRAINSKFRDYKFGPHTNLSGWYDRLVAEPYFYATGAATRMFLAGHTFYLPGTVDRCQWCNTFRSQSQHDLDKVLMNPLCFTHDQYRDQVKQRADKMWVVKYFRAKSKEPVAWKEAENACSLAARRC